MTRRWLLALGTLLLVAVPAATGAAPRERTLANGLRVLLDPDPQAVGIDVAVWYATGLADEPSGRSGLTHLMERLMFRGSPKFADGEYAKRMSRAGATFNTFLAPDFSAFYATGPGDALETMLTLEADRMAGQRLTAANVTAELRAVRDDQSRADDNPLTRGLQELYATAFRGQPYANPIQGKSADRARLTAAAVTEYAKARYGPGNALLTVVGQFEPAAAESLIAKTFGALPRRDPPAATAVPAPPPGERRGRVKLPLRLLLAGWTAPPDSACGPEMAVIAQVLGGGNHARLTAALSQRQPLAYGTQCVFDGRRAASLLYATAAVAPNADSATVERELTAQVEKLASEPLTDEELATARKAILLAARIERASVRGRGQALGAADRTDGSWRRADARLDRLEKLTPADVQKVAAAVLRPDHRAIVWSSAPPASATAKGSRP